MIVVAVNRKFSSGTVLGLLLLCSLGVVLLAPFFGAKTLSLGDVFSAQATGRLDLIFWNMRIPRVLVAFATGGIFAISGMAFQAMFRNPLVSPFTLGVSAGASFGASVYILFGYSFSILSISGISIFSFLGALLSISIVWTLAKWQEGATSTVKMLLAGVVVSFFFVSLIMFIQYLSDFYESARITRWLMGNLAVFGYESVLDVLPFAILGLLVIFYFSNDLNLLATGEEIAKSRGVDTERTILILFILVSLMIGGIVSICGPIAFVGIIAPHICRMLIGLDHRYLTPACFLFGGLFLTICDTLARSVAAPTEIPVGVITALLGGPFFLWLLTRRSTE